MLAVGWSLKSKSCAVRGDGFRLRLHCRFLVGVCSGALSSSITILSLSLPSSVNTSEPVEVSTVGFQFRLVVSRRDISVNMGENLTKQSYMGSSL